MNIKQLLKILLLTAALIGTSRFCHHATQGFRLSKIQSNLFEEATTQPNFNPEWLSHKFHFLGRGLQSFVFESEDGCYVLKLFNNRYQRKIRIFSLLSRVPLIGGWAESRAQYFQGKLLKTFQSYEIAFSEMKDKTGLLYIHLGATSHLPDRVTLIDRLNICHDINPNETGFLIQKKATLVYPALKEYLAHQDIEGVKHALSSLIGLFFWKWKNNIDDNDPLIRTNYGFIDGEAVQIDVGPLSKQAGLQNPKEIEKITASLKFWLETNAPELNPFLEQELQYQLSSMK